MVPTTLLSRQHFKTFNERFRGLPVHIGQASRLVSSTDLAKTKKGLAARQRDGGTGLEEALVSPPGKFG